MKVHVYRNRADDQRPAAELHFCHSCLGWYGVEHTWSHCQHRATSKYPDGCACRFCRAATGQPIQGRYGFFTDDPQWQPPYQTVDVGEFTVIREAGGEWHLWCGCGDLVRFPDVINGHCANCEASR
jgi:hypothetical protein